MYRSVDWPKAGVTGEFTQTSGKFSCCPGGGKVTIFSGRFRESPRFQEVLCRTRDAPSSSASSGWWS